MILFSLLVVLLLTGTDAEDVALRDTYVSLPNRIYVGLANDIFVRTTHPDTRVIVTTTKYRLNEELKDPTVYQTKLWPCGWHAVVIPYRVPFLFPDGISAGTITLNVTMLHCTNDACDQFVPQSLSQSYQVDRPPVHLLGETDKPLYRPGETVRLRFLIVDSQLLWPNSGPLITPSQKLVEEPEKDRLLLTPLTQEELDDTLTTPTFEEISVYDPNEQRVKQWLKLTRKEAFAISYTLLPDAPTGKWKIVARLAGIQSKTEELLFTVKPYVLPRFTISMTQPDKLAFESEHAEFSVCARYTNGPPMTGLVRAHLCVCSGSTSQSLSDQNIMLEEQACVPTGWHPVRRSCVPVSGVLSPADGCASFNVSTKLLDLKSSSYPTWEQVPVVCARVEEEGTGSNVSRCEPGTDTLKHTEARFELTAPDALKPDLPVVGQVRLIHPSLPSLKGVRVDLLAEETSPYCFFGMRRRVHDPNRYRFTQQIELDANGMAQFQIPPIESKRAVFLQVTYRTQGATASEAEPSSPHLFVLPRPRPPKAQGITAHKQMEKWLSFQRESMLIWPSSDAIQVTCPGSVQIQLLANTPLLDKTMHVEGVIHGMHFHHTIPPVNEPDPCVDRDDQLGHYRCLGHDAEPDQIECLPGWTGDNCLVPKCTRPCHSPGGVCSAPDQCSCFQYWTGSTCSECTEPQECGRSAVEVEQVGDLAGTDSEFTPIHSSTEKPVTTDECPETDSVPRRTLHLRNISFPVDGNWGPETTVIVYFMIQNSSSTAVIPVTVRLQNISTCISPATAAEFEQSGFTLSHHKVSPGQKIDLTLSPRGLSKPSSDDAQDDETQYCFVRMQDKSLDNFEGDKNVIDLNAIRRLHTEDSSTHFDRTEPSTVDSAFRAAGLRFMATVPTEVIQPMPCPYVSFLHRMGNGIAMAAEPEMMTLGRAGPAVKAQDSPQPDSPPIPKPRLRDFFPEVWLFDYYPIQWENTQADTGYVHQTLTVPDTITSWRANAFCTTKSQGLWLPNPQEVTTSMPFFVDIALPKQLKRGEILYLPISVFVSSAEESGNSECLAISVSASVDDDDWSVIGGQAWTDCVCPETKKTFQLGLLAKRLGLLNVTVIAYGRTGTSLCSDENSESTSHTFSDLVRRAIKVEPEGERKDVSQGDILCLSEDKRKAAKAEFSLVLPDRSDYVSESLRVYLTYSDEVLGPAMANLDKLVRLPVGCGEQNMVLVAPNVYILDYLMSVGSKVNSRGVEKLEREARMNILTGYQRQQKYRHDDGSYSAFGKSDQVGSTWLTAFVFRVFAKAYKVDRTLQIDWSQMFTEITHFLKKRQDEVTGCFLEKGRVLHTGMQGGAGAGDEKEKELLLTAYILASILETKPNDGSDFSPEFSPIIEAAKRCLYERHSLNHPETTAKTNTYALAQLAYTLTLLDPRTELVRRLQQELARRQKHASANGLSQPLQYWLAREPKTDDEDELRSVKIDALDVETTSYALLTLNKNAELHSNDLFPIVRWLSSQQKPEGGFFSTQDTAMALEAISLFAKRLGLSGTSTKGGPMHVKATIDPVGFRITETVTIEKQQVLNQFSGPSHLTPEDVQTVTWVVDSSAPRGGCLAVHSTLVYHVHTNGESRDTVFQMTSLVRQDQGPPANACTMANVSVCLTPNVNDAKETGMLLVTAKMVSGWKPVPEVILQQITGKREDPRQIEFSADDSSVSVYFDGFAQTKENPSDWFKKEKRCVQLTLKQSAYVKNAEPAIIEAIDYYTTSRRTSKIYKLDECSSAWIVEPPEEEPSLVSTTPTTLITPEPVSLHCPICELSVAKKQELNEKMLKYVCHSWSNLLGMKINEAKDSKYKVTLSSIGFGRAVSSWNATLVSSAGPECQCKTLTVPNKALWLSPKSKLTVEPGDPIVDIHRTDPDALLISIKDAWPAIEMARNQWQSDNELNNTTSDRIMPCSRIDTLWRYVKSNLL